MIGGDEAFPYQTGAPGDAWCGFLAGGAGVGRVASFLSS